MKKVQLKKLIKRTFALRKTLLAGAGLAGYAAATAAALIINLPTPAPATPSQPVIINTRPITPLTTNDELKSAKKPKEPQKTPTKTSSHSAGSATTQQTTPSRTTTISSANQRAMWVWDSSTIVSSTSQKNQLLDFADAKGIQTLYFYSEGLINSNPSGLSSFVTSATARSIDIELLFGEPEWALNSGHSQAVSFMQKAVAFANSLPAGSRPVGAHFDVEPNGLPQWGSDQTDTAKQYIGMLDALHAAKSSLRLSVDTAMAYDYRSITPSGTEAWSR